MLNKIPQEQCLAGLVCAFCVVQHESVLVVQMVPGGAVGIAGQIKLVHAEHFMCHSNFDVEFG